MPYWAAPTGLVGRIAPFLTPLAPTQSEPPFAVVQLLVLAIFVALGVLAVRMYHPEDGPPLSSLA